MTIKSANNLQELAWLFGCTAKQLGYYLYKRSLSSQYKRFEIKKKRGGVRVIHAPQSNIKLIQQSIRRELDKLKLFKPCVNGYVRNRNIITNARPHVGQRFVLNIDLEDFFGAINYGRVYGLLSKPPFKLSKPVAAAIAKACTLDNKLPQGAPSSPIISNLVCSKLDSELSRLAKAHGCSYTRYADDLTFSSSGSMSLATRVQQPDGTSVCNISPTLSDIIESNGFRINQAKVRLAQRQHRQEVTGLIVNKRINVKRRYVREVRAMLHAWQKFGLAAAQKDFNALYSGSSDFEAAVRGKIGFIGHVRGRPDKVFKKFATQFNALAKGPKIRTELTPEEIVLQAVWVVEHDSDQGTAFFLEGYGLVTCAHCVGSGPIVIYHPADHTKKFSVALSNKNVHKDLAILDFPSALSEIIPIPLSKTSVPPKGASVHLFGYPAHHAARPVRVEAGTIIRSFPKSAVTYLEITPKIIGGNSGGPVVNETFAAVGVAVLGLNGEIDLKSTEFLAVSVDEFKGMPTSKIV